MPRKRRNLKTGYSHHITTRCNNHEFKLARHECREVFLYAVKKVLDKYKFKLYAICIMSNHVHYLIEPAQANELLSIFIINTYHILPFKIVIVLAIFLDFAIANLFFT
ncbi:transposase [Nostoc sp.]|uniref:transposase n=1 Tax=Nostoc sp. TaxID=1180 RepID=UPI002FFA6A8A